MNKKLIYNSIPILFAVLVLAILFLNITFTIPAVNGEGIKSQPRRYFSTVSTVTQSESYPIFPFLLVALLYLVTQFFVFSHIKKCYGSFKNARVIVYIVCVAVSAPFVFIPYFLLQLRELFVTGLNPYIGNVLYLPICFQMFLWVDMMIRLWLGGMKRIQNV